MSFTDALTRIQQIQTEIAEVADPATTAQPAATTATATPSVTATSTAAGTDSSSAAQFSSALESASSTTATAASGSALVQNGKTGADVIADAQKYLGVPYVFGGTTTSGMDCSGLVQTVFKDLGITMPRTVGPQSQMGQTVNSLADAQPGDLIVEKGDGHIQIYAGNGMIIEAPKPGENVVERKEWLSSDEIGTIRRIVPATTADSTSGSAATAESTALASQLAALNGTSGSDSSQLSSLLSGSSSTSSLASLLAQSGNYSSLATSLGGSL
ncbi:C40 family peptidase [Curtobacterium sp. MCBD17_040]|uniref:C40 family peptidase n=1 Tax=Curtobacterium sp. MCBD17_040 TaxID=2175674 RepID=UPI000DA779D8|nr:C40 family peptidase [Curtobacterium sp. MCBD17_040]WIB65580.1 C40 family peptidase [Curtobacterium sp. MCBD17_040]